MTRVRTALPALVALACACEGDRPRGAAEPTEEVSLATAAGGRSVVAEVDGRPIYATCVRAQARAHDLDRRAALDQCVAFELLARAAEDRGHASHPDVLAARARESVRALLARTFEAEFAGPSDVPMEHVKDVWPRVKRRFDHPPLRETVHVRVPIKKKKAGTRADDDARALAEEIHRALAGRDDLTAERFHARAREIAGERTIELGDAFQMPRHGRAVEPFARAAFAIPEVGMISEPTRTRWGWDVLLLVGNTPEEHRSMEEAAPTIREKIFAMSRKRSFRDWVSALAGERDVRIHEDRLGEVAPDRATSVRSAGGR